MVCPSLHKQSNHFCLSGQRQVGQRWRLPGWKKEERREGSAVECTCIFHSVCILPLSIAANEKLLFQESLDRSESALCLRGKICVCVGVRKCSVKTCLVQS